MIAFGYNLTLLINNYLEFKDSHRFTITSKCTSKINACNNFVKAAAKVFRNNLNKFVID
jgi:hypothetical protein